MAKCEGCGKEITKWNTETGSKICIDCANQQSATQKEAHGEELAGSTVPEWLQEAQQSAPEQEPKARVVQKTKYPALRIVAGIYYILAFLVGAAAVVVIVMGLSQQSLAVATAGAVGGLLGAVTCVAAAELVEVFLDTEENTRNCFSALSQILDKK